ncbi:MAG: hypothetical protein V1696_01605 [Candidatus Jorgensenbacteria bacterium]
MENSPHKIFFNPKDSPDDVIDRALRAPGDIVVVNIPRGSLMGIGLEHFVTLKSEAAAAGKTITVESVDDHVLELAGLAGLRAVNPVFRIRERAVSDIVPRSRVATHATPRASEHPQSAEVSQKPKSAAPTPARHAREKPPAAPEPRPEPPVFSPSAFSARAPERSAITAHLAPHPVPAHPRRRARRGLLVGGGVLVVLLAGGAFLAIVVLPRATIAMNLKATTVDFTEQVRVDSKASSVRVESGRTVLPGELFVARKNVELSFPASGTKRVETKASGKLSIFNAYSSSRPRQVLVAGTRIESPDKKIFRLNQRVEVPEAKVQDGKIVPSSIEVAVTADSGGEEYNVPAAKDWRIPGLKGSPKYEAFYGESLAPMSGGFVGEQALPTDADLAAARAKVSQTLQDALKSQLILALGDTFKVLDGTQQFKVLRDEVRTGGSDPKTFSLFGEAELRELTLVESMLRDAIVERAAHAISYPVTARDFKLAYDTPQVEAGAQAMNVAVKGSVTLVPTFDPEQFRESILGNDEQTLKATVFALPGLETAKVSLWPFWVHSVPTAPGKVNVTVE